MHRFTQDDGTIGGEGGLGRFAGWKDGNGVPDNGVAATSRNDQGDGEGAGRGVGVDGVGLVTYPNPVAKVPGVGEGAGAGNGRGKVHRFTQDNGTIGGEGSLGGKAEDLDGQAGLSHAAGVAHIDGDEEGAVSRIGVGRRGRVQTASVARAAKVPGVGKVGRKTLDGGRKVHGVSEFDRAIAREGDGGGDAAGDDAEGVGQDRLLAIAVVEGEGIGAGGKGVRHHRVQGGGGDQRDRKEPGLPQFQVRGRQEATAFDLDWGSIAVRAVIRHHALQGRGRVGRERRRDLHIVYVPTYVAYGGIAADAPADVGVLAGKGPQIHRHLGPLGQVSYPGRPAAQRVAVAGVNRPVVAVGGDIGPQVAPGGTAVGGDLQDGAVVAGPLELVTMPEGQGAAGPQRDGHGVPEPAVGDHIIVRDEPGVGGAVRLGGAELPVVAALGGGVAPLAAARFHVVEKGHPQGDGGKVEGDGPGAASAGVFTQHPPPVAPPAGQRFRSGVGGVRKAAHIEQRGREERAFVHLQSVGPGPGGLGPFEGGPEGLVGGTVGRGEEGRSIRRSGGEVEEHLGIVRPGEVVGGGDEDRVIPGRRAGGHLQGEGGGEGSGGRGRNDGRGEAGRKVAHLQVDRLRVAQDAVHDQTGGDNAAFAQFMLGWRGLEGEGGQVRLQENFDRRVAQDVVGLPVVAGAAGVVRFYGGQPVVGHPGDGRVGRDGEQRVEHGPFQDIVFVPVGVGGRAPVNQPTFVLLQHPGFAEDFGLAEVAGEAGVAGDKGEHPVVGQVADVGGGKVHLPAVVGTVAGVDDGPAALVEHLDQVIVGSTVGDTVELVAAVVVGVGEVAGVASWAGIGIDDIVMGALGNPVSVAGSREGGGLQPGLASGEVSIGQVLVHHNGGLVGRTYREAAPADVGVPVGFAVHAAVVKVGGGADDGAGVGGDGIGIADQEDIGGWDGPGIVGVLDVGFDGGGAQAAAGNLRTTGYGDVKAPAFAEVGQGKDGVIVRIGGDDEVADGGGRSEGPALVIVQDAAGKRFFEGGGGVAFGQSAGEGHIAPRQLQPEGKGAAEAEGAGGRVVGHRPDLDRPDAMAANDVGFAQGQRGLGIEAAALVKVAVHDEGAVFRAGDLGNGRLERVDREEARFGQGEVGTGGLQRFQGHLGAEGDLDLTAQDGEVGPADFASVAVARTVETGIELSFGGEVGGPDAGEIGPEDDGILIGGKEGEGRLGGRGTSQGQPALALGSRRWAGLHHHRAKGGQESQCGQDGQKTAGLDHLSPP